MKKTAEQLANNILRKFAALATTYDSAKWHPEGGSAHLKQITALLKNKGLLSPEGLEAADAGVDSEYSLTAHMLTPEGKNFMDKNYSDWTKARRY
jgi:hypothetical protein